MASYKSRKHATLASNPTVTYVAGHVFTGTPINIEPHTLIAGLSEV